MNFLSHYYFDRHCTDPNRVMGTVLPDLVKNTNKKWSFHPSRHQAALESDPVLKSIYDGWMRHILIDRHFHSSDFFSRHTGNIRRRIVPALENCGARPFFVAHISLELMLDSLLLNAGKVSTAQFYRQIGSADKPGLVRFLMLNGIEETAPFFHFLEGFIGSAYLDSYREAEHMLYALNRICLRVWNEPFNETQKMQLTTVLPEYLEELQDDFMLIFREIGEKIGMDAGSTSGATYR